MRYVVFWVLLGTVFLSSTYADSHHPQAFLDKIKGSKDEGMQIYKHFCSTCHAEKPMISLGAPRFAHKEDWQPRLKQGLAVLLHHVDEGFNNMPPRGGCFECSDEQLKLAIIEMIQKSTNR